MLDKIRDNFTESIQTAIAASEEVAAPIEQASMIMVQCLLNGNKVLVCGSGNSAANAQLFASYLLNSYETERPSFPAISLVNDNITLLSIANNASADDFFATQVRALGANADILLAISPSGDDTCVLKAVETAISRDMPIVALTGNDGGSLAGLLGDADVEIRIPSTRESRIQEVHQFVLHCLCDLIDSTLFPQGEQ